MGIKMEWHVHPLPNTTSGAIPLSTFSSAIAALSTTFSVPPWKTPLLSLP
jgi:hypothetical protein